MQTKDLVKKIKILMITRLVLVTLVMVTGSFVLQVEKIPFYTLIAVVYFLTCVYAFLVRFDFPLHINAYLQIVIDIVLETIIIHYAGGADSIFALLYVPSIVASGIIIGSRAAKTIAGLSSIFYGAVSGLEYFGIISPVHGTEKIYTEGFYSLLFVVSFRIILFCLIGYLSSYLSRELQKERVELVKLRNLSDIILKNISSGVLTLDTESRIVYANPAAERILQQVKGSMLGVYWPGLIWGKIDEEIVKLFINEAKLPAGVEIKLDLSSEKKLILNFSYSDLTDEKNNIVGGVLTFVDLTRLKELELELCQREKLSAMGEMAVSIAHEIRNPMASIRGALEVLREKGKFQVEGEKLVEVVFKESDRLNRILEDFLKYAKDRKPDIKHEDAAKLIDEVWLLARQGEMWHKGIKLQKNLNPLQVVLHVDRDQMKQVFYNLFINAMEAMPRGGIINVDVEDKNFEVVIKVKDDGIGISKEMLDKTFQHFQSTKLHGLGMGLAITRRIIEAHNGTIDLYSEQGKGTTVTITLPK